MSVEHFGRVVTAMATPFDDEGQLDLSGAATLAAWLTTPGRSDGLVVNGTTGESATTSDTEKNALVREVRAAVRPEVKVVAGVGTSDTDQSITLARNAEAAGADGLLVVTPYYSKPTQAGILAHVTAIADSTSLPVMLYDIPGRSGVALTSTTLIEAAKHERIVAVKDAKADIPASSDVMTRCDLTYYAGDDVLTLPLASVGASGVVSVAAHFVPELFHSILDGAASGDPDAALQAHRTLLPICEALMSTPAAASVKTLLTELGLPGGPVRPPLCGLTEAERHSLVGACAGVVHQRIEVAG